jgi:hypothetical protein
MKRFSLKQTVVMVGAVAALALGTGVVPGAANSIPTAQAAELGQHGGHGGHGGGHSGHGGSVHNNGGFRHHGGGFHGHRFWHREGFEHRFWGWGFHRTYPQYYVSYAYEPVSVCSAYYVAEDEGVWYCFTGE